MMFSVVTKWWDQKLKRLPFDSCAKLQVERLGAQLGRQSKNGRMTRLDILTWINCILKKKALKLLLINRSCDLVVVWKVIFYSIIRLLCTILCTISLLKSVSSIPVVHVFLPWTLLNYLILLDVIWILQCTQNIGRIHPVQSALHTKLAALW